jgi:two-component system sensor histidine kinase FlrB
VDRLRRLEVLVKDMLAFARQGKFEVEELEIGEFFMDFVQSVEPQLTTHGVSLELRNEAPSLRIRGNAEALQSAFQNLIDNAIQWGGSGTRLHIVLRQQAPQELSIEVIDDGPGIAPELQGRVLKPFFTTRSGGAGLGLAVVRGIVSAHRGALTIESNPPASGTQVRITLPISGSEEVACGRPSALGLAPALARPDSLTNRAEGFSE